MQSVFDGHSIDLLLDESFLYLHVHVQHGLLHAFQLVSIQYNIDYHLLNGFNSHCMGRSVG